MRSWILRQGALGAVLVAVGAVTGVAWERARADVQRRAEQAAQEQAAQEQAPQVRQVAQVKADLSRPKVKAPAPAHSCNICGHHGRFLAIGSRPEASCPRCKSRERHRLMMHYLQHATPLFSEELEVLHFSPMKGEADRLRKLKHLKYVTAEYEAGKADLQLDLTALAQPDASWDVLIAYHILEHIIDDRKAMAEMFRVLRPGGMVILQVPLDPSRTEIFEDPTVVDPAQRARLFGQWDHVRWYSAAGLKERLEQAGFEVEAVDYLGQLEPEVVETFSMHSRARAQQDEDIWVARKPRRAAAKGGAKKKVTKSGAALAAGGKL